MKTFQDRIKNNIEYFRGMEINGGLYIIKVQYPAKWGTYNSQDDVIKVAKSEEKENEYFYYAKIDESSIDDILDLIERTITINTEAQMKIQLMLTKIEELKELFANNSLNKLETLYFAFNEVTNKTADSKPKRKYNKKKKKEQTSEELVEESITNEEVTNEVVHVE